MCGRFTLQAEQTALQAAFPETDVSVVTMARYNIAPTQPVAVIANDEPTRVQFFHWGLIPAWAKDPSIGNRMINARAETLAEKPSFRHAFKRRRCLVLADGFYEWAKQPAAKQKIPTYIRLTSGQPFAFAGLWETWHSPDGSEIASCTIITTTPNELLAPIHDRMAVILPPSAYALWLDTAEHPPEILAELLRPYPAREMMAHPVAPLVNNPRHDSPDCIKPLAQLW